MRFFLIQLLLILPISVQANYEGVSCDYVMDIYDLADFIVDQCDTGKHSTLEIAEGIVIENDVDGPAYMNLSFSYSNDQFGYQNLFKLKNKCWRESSSDYYCPKSFKSREY